LPSARPSEIKARRSRALLVPGIAAGVLVVLYLLLLSGNLAWAVKLGVNLFANQGDLTVDVYGFASGVFFGTRADSVVVRDSGGLRVVVSGIRVRGSLYGYAAGTGLGSIHADSLGIVIPSPDPDREAEPDPDMGPLFDSILKGFVTSADTLRILRGSIIDHNGTLLLDSMRISAGVSPAPSAGLEVHSVGAFLPEFGPISGSGTILLNRERVTLQGFSVVVPMAELNLGGVLEADSSLALQGTGRFSTESIPGAPPARGLLTLTVLGTTGNPQGVVAISEGSIHFMDRDVSFSADSLSGSMAGAGLGALDFLTQGLSGNISGDVVFEGPQWNGTVGLVFTGVDPSSWDADAPSGFLTGNLSIHAQGTGEELSSGNLVLVLQGSSLDGYPIDALRLNAAVDPSRVSGTLSLAALGAQLNSTWSLALGNGYRPVSWSGTAELSIPDARRVMQTLDPGSPLSGVNGVSVALTGRGTPERFQVSCDAGVRSFGIDGISTSGVYLRGDAAVNLASGNGVRVDFNGTTGLGHLEAGEAALSGVALNGNLRLGIPARGAPSIRFTGTVSADTAAMAEIVALEPLADVDFSMAGGLPSGSVALRAHSILTPGGSMALDIRGESRNGIVNLDSIHIRHERGLAVSAGVSADLTGESLSMSLDSIRITMNKLRLVRAGGAEASLFADGTLEVDTLWIDPPAGYVSGSGSVAADGAIQASFDIRAVDIASLGFALGLDLPVSGVLSAFVEASGMPGTDLEARLSLSLDDPTYGPWTQGDSITVNADLTRGVLTVDGIWIWSDNIRSGVRFSMDSLWIGTSIDFAPERLAWLEAELSGVGDWLLYILPFPVMTSGASISSRIEYNRDLEYISAGVAGHFQRLFLAGAQMEFPMSSVYFSYPDTRASDEYNASFRITSGQGREPDLTAEFRARVRENLPFRTGDLPLEVEGYSFLATLNGWEAIINGVGWISMSGNLSATENDLTRRPMLRGKIRLDQGVIALASQQGGAGAGESQNPEIPLDLYIVVQAERGLWLRSSYMNIELAADITVLTQERRPVFTGSISVVRGTLNVLNKDFRITHGTIEIVQGTPPGLMMNITAESRVRSSMSREMYTITVNVTGDPENPEIALSGTGVARDLTSEDIVTLLTLGMTYGEMQQMDTGALETELESITQSVLGSMIARNIREGMGLDALSISPDLLADSTGLTVEVGKYVLPDLYVSYTDDIFSPRPGTISAQYFFSRDIYLEGSSKTTISGSQEPTIELHYTIRY
jgi:hypothetical protein